MLKLKPQMVYNLTMVLRSTLKDADRKKLVDGVKDSFGKAKVTEKDWGQKPLSYPIEKEVSGYFVSLTAETEEVLSKDFEKKIYSNGDVLRHLFLRKQ
jgi:ribosomal protein S6